MPRCTSWVRCCGTAPKRKSGSICLKIATGELRLQAFGVTEPDAGTDTTRISTTAERRGDTFVVNGEKVFISRVQHSDLMLLLVRTTPREQVAKRTHGLSLLLVDLQEAVGNGMVVEPIYTMMNNETNRLEFHDLEAVSYTHLTL